MTLEALGAKMDRVIHTRWRHHGRHPALVTALDGSLVVIATLLVLWAVFVLVMLVHAAAKTGA